MTRKQLWPKSALWIVVAACAAGLGPENRETRAVDRPGVAQAAISPATVPATTPARDWASLLRQLGSGDFAEREAAQRKLEQVAATDFPMLIKLAQSEKDEEVKARLQARIDTVKANADSYYAQALAQYAHQDYAQAAADYTIYLYFKPEVSEAYYNRGLAREFAGNLTGAIEDYTKATTLKPDYAAAFLNRGNLRARRNEMREALADFDRAVQLTPADVLAYYDRGYAKKELGDAQGAINDYTTAISMNPREPNAYYNRGITEFDEGDFAVAAADASKVIDLDSTYGYAYCNRGVARLAMGDEAAALADFSKGLELNPNQPWTIHNRGMLQFGRQKWADALADFRQELALDAARDGGQFYLWLCRARLGEKDAATKDLQQYLKQRKANEKDWAGKVGAFLTGQIAEAELLRVAQNHDEKTEASQLCCAYFYAGEMALIAGDKVHAEQLFKNCAAKGKANMEEYSDAVAEFKLLQRE